MGVREAFQGSWYPLLTIWPVERRGRSAAVQARSRASRGAPGTSHVENQQAALTSHDTPSFPAVGVWWGRVTGPGR